MQVAVFGSKIFSTSLSRIYPLDGLSISGSINKETQDRQGQKPTTYIKGLGLEAISVSIPLVAQKTVNVRSELDSWRKIRDARIPYYFIIAGKPLVSNKMLLESVDTSDVILDQNGNFIKATMQLKFEEYVVLSHSSSSKSNAVKPKAVKSSKKRTNNNYLNAVSSGGKLLIY